jgi:hypothetical protein
MMRTNSCRFLIPALLTFLIVTTVRAGGWAIVTVNELPDYVMSGKPLILTFAVRQHGVTLLDGLKPSVRATASGRGEARAMALPTGKAGEYTATLTFPAAGAWTIRVESGFNANDPTLPVVHVIDKEASTPAPLPPVARGERLFVSKGCIGCHRNQEIAAPNLISAGPDLTGKRFPADRLQEFLTDPGKALKRSAKPEYGQMPNLSLSQTEVASLVAFINRDRIEGSTR